jgi:hypothetical protein
MLDAAWLYVGRIAFAWSVLTVVAAVYVNPGDKTGDDLATVAGVVGFVLWGVWTFGALNIEVVQGTNTVSFSQPELAILGVAMALVPGYIALTGPIELIDRYREPSADEL